MSKAFTRESDDSDDDGIPPVRPAVPTGTINYITPEGAERLRQRLEHLLNEKGRMAASQPEVRKLEGDIRALQHTLNSVVVAKAPSTFDKIAFGATIHVCDQNGEEEIYRIVGIEEAEPEKNLISWLSPLARALLSRRIGDKVRFQTPGGARELTVLSIK